MILIKLATLSSSILSSSSVNFLISLSVTPSLTSGLDVVVVFTVGLLVVLFVVALWLAGPVAQ